MDEIERGVISCFAIVFSGLDEETIRNASVDSLSEWSSIAHVTLLSAIAEEFGLHLDLDDFEELTSFSRIVARLRSS